MKQYTAQLVATGIIVAAVLGARFAIGRFVRRQTWVTVEDARRWLVMARNVTLVVGIVAIAIVWAEELRVIGLSLVAVAVAVAISGQDIIRSMVASLARATLGTYEIGDRISAGEVRGTVIDHSLLSTRLLEIGDHNIRTGRTVSVPNSYFLTHPVFNETAGQPYVLHTMEVEVSLDEVHEAQAILSKAAEEFSAEYLAPARRHIETAAYRSSLPVPNVDAVALVSPRSASTAIVSVRFPAASLEAWTVEQQIFDRWLTGRKAARNHIDDRPT